MTRAPNKHLDQSTSNLAIALRARETLCHEENWCTGYRYLNDRMCLTGHILKALGARTRAHEVNDPSERNFVYNEEQTNKLATIVHSLGFACTESAERYNDSNGVHGEVLDRYDEGLKNWKD